MKDKSEAHLIFIATLRGRKSRYNDPHFTGSHKQRGTDIHVTIPSPRLVRVHAPSPQQDLLRCLPDPPTGPDAEWRSGVTLSHVKAKNQAEFQDFIICDLLPLEH